MNLTIMIGRLCKDPELKYIPSTGKAVANFTIAVDRPFSKEKQADFFNVQVWGKVAENCANYLAKGSKAAIKGTIQNRSYDAQDGTKKYITEIIADSVEFLDSKKDAGFTPKSLDNEYTELNDSDVPF